MHNWEGLETNTKIQKSYKQDQPSQYICLYEIMDFFTCIIGDPVAPENVIANISALENLSFVVINWTYNNTFIIKSFRVVLSIDGKTILNTTVDRSNRNFSYIFPLMETSTEPTVIVYANSFCGNVNPFTTATVSTGENGTLTHTKHYWLC